ncbi:MAG TPA: hemin uptake protein HemP [Gammaproteobacteria bacterium]
MTTSEQEKRLDEIRHLVPNSAQPIPSEWLFARGDEVRIRHQGQEYRLRRTRANKLILTK